METDSLQSDEPNTAEAIELLPLAANKQKNRKKNREPGKVSEPVSQPQQSVSSLAASSAPPERRCCTCRRRPFEDGPEVLLPGQGDDDEGFPLVRTASWTSRGVWRGSRENLEPREGRRRGFCPGRPSPLGIRLALLRRGYSVSISLILCGVLGFLIALKLFGIFAIPSYYSPPIIGGLLVSVSRLQIHFFQTV